MNEPMETKRDKLLDKKFRVGLDDEETKELKWLEVALAPRPKRPVPIRKALLEDLELP